MKAVIVCLALAASCAAAEPTPAEGSAPAAVAPNSTPAHKTVEHDGQVFELASSSSARNVETDEYVATGETLSSWTQLVTVQRLTVAPDAAGGDFVAYLEKRITADGTSFQILKRTKDACVFAVRFAAADAIDEQVMICLSVVDRTQSSSVNVVQFAIKPARLPVETVEARIKSWRDKFLQQVSALEDSTP